MANQQLCYLRCDVEKVNKKFIKLVYQKSNMNPDVLLFLGMTYASKFR